MEDVQLAAVISSYLKEDDGFVPIFGFQSVSLADDDKEDEFEDEHVISRSRARTLDILLGNALSRIKGTENLILGGLSANQKSYLRFLDKFNVIEIDTVAQVDFALGAFFSDLTNHVQCLPNELHQGLWLAYENNAILDIVGDAAEIIIPSEDKPGLVVIEQTNNINSILAINYARRIGAAIKIVPAISDFEEYEINFLIEGWRSGIEEDFVSLGEKVSQRVLKADVQNYDFATFF
ncbi:MAG: hypothetical protein EOO43_05175, partial [Flavobacterium sp.]